MRLNLFLADHFEELKTGKILAVGLHSDRTMVLNVPPDTPEPMADAPMASDTAMMVTLSHLPLGKHQGQIQVLAPNLRERPVMSVAFQCDVQTEGASVNIILPIRPLFIPRMGTYSVEVSICDTVLIKNFEVRMRFDPDAPMVVPSADAQPQPT